MTARAIQSNDRETFATANSGNAVREGDAFERVLFWALIAGLGWCPFLFGSNTPTAWGINAMLFCGLAVIYEVGLLVRAKPHPIGVRHLALPAGLFAAAPLWAIFQNATWTPIMLHHPIWGMASNALDRPILGSISTNRDLTTLALLRLATGASVFWLSLQLCRNPWRAELILRSIVIIVAAYAAYGLVAFAVMPGSVLWFENHSMSAYLTSTFFNRNHFATYAGLGLVIALGFIVQLYSRDVSRAGGLRLRAAEFIEVTGRKGGALLLSITFVILVALLATGSRGGIIASFTGLVGTCALLVARAHKRAMERGLAAIALVMLGVVAIFIFGDQFLNRMMQGGIEGRVASYQITLRSIWDAPLLGYGFGTFEDVFPMFRDRSMTVAGVWDRAHNTYLEYFQGLGLVFGLMIPMAVVILFLRCLRGAKNRKEDIAPAVAIGAAVVVAAHAFIDFSLQIQAVSLTFAAILAAGVAQSESSRLVLSD
jgi:O-antigen ligase